MQTPLSFDRGTFPLLLPVAALFALSLFLPLTVRAEVHTFDLAPHVTVIESAEGLSRLLIDLSFLDTLAGRTIYDARLTLPRLPVSERLSLEIAPVTTDWSPESASWAGGWEEAGGDYAKGEAVRLRVTPRANPPSWEFSLTSLLVDRLREDQLARGLLLLRSPSEAVGLTSTIAEAFTSSGALVLTVHSGDSTEGGEEG